MQDQSPHQPGASAQPTGTYYPVLTIGLADLESAIAPFASTLDDADYLTDEEQIEQQQRLEFVRQMSPEQWRHLADYIGDILYDSDRWDNALQEALARELSNAAAVSDHQAMPGAAPAGETPYDGPC